LLFQKQVVGSGVIAQIRVVAAKELVKLRCFRGFRV